MGHVAGALTNLDIHAVCQPPKFSWPVMLFFSLYSMGLVELVERHCFPGLRRLSPSLYSVVPSHSVAPCHALPCPCGRRPSTVPGLLPQGLWQGHGTVLLLRAKGSRLRGGANLVKHIGLFSALVQLSPPVCSSLPRNAFLNWPILEFNIELFIWTWLLADNSLFKGYRGIGTLGWLRLNISQERWL